MEARELIRNLESQPEFIKWKKQNKDSYLVHILRLLDEPDNDWQIGYYNKDDTITSFSIIKNEVKIFPKEEIFKKTKDKLKKLDISKLKIDFDKALGIATNLQQNKYQKDIPLKRIVILQNLEIGNVWNITFLTHTFNTLNFKISCKDGKVKEEKLTPLMSFADLKQGGKKK